MTREKHTQAAKDIAALVVAARVDLSYVRNAAKSQYVRDAWRARGLDPDTETRVSLANAKAKIDRAYRLLRHFGLEGRQVVEA